MADPDNWEEELSDWEDGVLSDLDVERDFAFMFEGEPEPPQSLTSRLRDEFRELLGMVPGTRGYWSRMQESARDQVEWMLREFYELKALSAGQKQDLLPRIRTIEEKIGALEASEQLLVDKLMPAMALVIMSVMGLLAPFLANGWWVSGDYHPLTWLLLCGASTLVGFVLGFGVLLLGLAIIPSVPRAAQQSLRRTPRMFMEPAILLPGLGILAFWLIRGVATMGSGQPDSGDLLRLSVPLAGAGVSVALGGVITFSTAWRFAHATWRARQHTPFLIPHALLNILIEIESRPLLGETARVRRYLADGLEGVADLISLRLPRHLVSGDPATDAWIRTITAEMANHLRWLKIRLLMPEPDSRQRLMAEIAEALLHSANGHWGGLQRRPMDTAPWRQALSRAWARIAVYLTGLAWAVALPLALRALQRTAYALSGWAADLATVGVLLWAAVLVLIVLDRLFSVRMNALLGLVTSSWWGADPQIGLDYEAEEWEADAEGTVFLTVVGNAEQRTKAELLIDSLRAFGGPLRDCPVWLFEADPEGAPCADLTTSGVEVHPLTVPESVRDYWFAAKVCACARAEEMAGPEVRSLVWLAPDCLIIQPPVLLALGWDRDAAVRPVHHKNIGLRVDEPLDAFWERVYEAVGMTDVPVFVTSYVDGQWMRAYYNSHILAVKPVAGVFREWFRLFEELAGDQAFQQTACSDEQHQVFLHQAVLSALLAERLQEGRVHLLPPTYSYPYNLHGRLEASHRATKLDDLVCIAYEHRSLDPFQVDDIEIREPLRSWLGDRVESRGFAG